MARKKTILKSHILIQHMIFREKHEGFERIYRLEILAKTMNCSTQQFI